MASISRSAIRTAPSIHQRGFTSTATALAAAKGKTGQKAPAKAKPKAASFSQNKPGAPKRSGGGGGGSSSGVTLKYSEASDVPDLGEFQQFIPDVVGQSSVGHATTFPQEVFQQLKSLGLPRRLDKEMERSGGPAAVVRQSTVDLARLLDKGKNGSSKEFRHVLAGQAGSGKSTLLLQSAAYARESGWIVLYIPRASEWIESKSQYRYDSSTKSFTQPALASTLLSSLLTTNPSILESITIKSSLGPFKSGTTIAEICRSTKSTDAVEVLEGVLETLGKQIDVPVLIAIDEVQALFSTSGVRTPDYKILESYHLSTPKLILDYLTGKKALSKGTIITALSHSTPSLPIPSEMYQALSIPSPTPLTPYTKYEPIHLENARSGLQKIEVPWRMSSEEAAGIWRIWAKKGWARGTDETFLGALSASSGNIKEFTRGLARNLQALPA